MHVCVGGGDSLCGGGAVKVDAPLPSSIIALSLLGGDGGGGLADPQAFTALALSCAAAAAATHLAKPQSTRNTSASATALSATNSPAFAAASAVEAFPAPPALSPEDEAAAAASADALAPSVHKCGFGGTAPAAAYYPREGGAPPVAAVQAVAAESNVRKVGTRPPAAAENSELKPSVHKCGLGGTAPAAYYYPREDVAPPAPAAAVRAAPAVVEGADVVKVRCPGQSKGGMAIWGPVLCRV